MPLTDKRQLWHMLLTYIRCEALMIHLYAERMTVSVIIFRNADYQRRTGWSEKLSYLTRTDV